MTSNTRAFVWTSDPDSVELARKELFAGGRAAQEYELAPGVWLAAAPRPFASYAHDWKTAPPVFVRHAHPVDFALPLVGDESDAAWVGEVVAAHSHLLIERLEAGIPFSVQSRVFGQLPFKPFDINRALSEAALAGGAGPLDVRAPVQVISVVAAPVPDGWIDDARRLGLMPRTDHDPNASQHALVGLSTVDQNLSGWAGGMRRFAREAGQVSRAEFKLLEAIELFGVQVREHGVALDLGASPGGWTRVLRHLGQYVTAVDPGELDPRVGEDNGVRHKRMTAEEYLRTEPDRFDLIVNDMRMDARDSARLMVAYAPHLYPHGAAVMTIKLPEEQREPVIEQALKTLRGAFEITGARQLFHNRSEITVALRPRP